MGFTNSFSVLQHDVSIQLLRSAFTESNPFISTSEVLAWLQQRNNEVTVTVEQIAFNQLQGWQFDEDQSSLRHVSGRFFSIDGIDVQTNWGLVPTWQQPIINQPEIGYLGILVKEFDGVLYFLLQAKIEPGNINNVQLSPTLQATKSNYTQVHGGKQPAYLEHFKNASPANVLFDQLQSEQGARFLQKRNRNLIVKVDEDITVQEDFVWLTLAQIKLLMRHSNVVNMDTRTVISCISYKLFSEFGMNGLPEGTKGTLFFKSFFEKNIALYSFDELIAWITQLKCQYELRIRQIPLHRVKGWVITDSEIKHESGRFFKVIATKVAISNREVSSWSQPLVQPINEGLIAFVITEIHGVLHFLVQAKLECGNFDILELAPTVQTITGDYRNPEYTVPFLDVVLNAAPENIWYDAKQSEEGGRFYQEQNRNLIVHVPNAAALSLPENFTWMTLHQLQTFIKFNNYLNIQARSLLSTIGFI